MGRHVDRARAGAAIRPTRPDLDTMIECSIGVMAHNEEPNIGRLLQQLLRQELQTVIIRRVVVVASGCTDGTVEIVRRSAAEQPRVRLIVQEERRGKASAINEFLPEAVGDVVVLESADTLPVPDAVEQLVRPFLDPSVGMTGARPIPTNDPRTFWGYAAHLLWGLHHDIALQHPKLGEMIAFRNVLKSIPNDTAVDEAAIEAAIADRDLDIRYCPEAKVYNSGSATLGDFVRQRRRIHAGHLHLRAETDYRVSTMSTRAILPILLRRLELRPRTLLFTGAVVGLEGWARLLATYDHCVRKRNPYVWDVAQSTKVLHLAEPDQEAGGNDAQP